MRPTVLFEVESVGCCYIEGAIQAVEVDGPIHAAWRIEDASEAQLPPGDYSVTLYEQVCSGNCDWLGEPRNPCLMTVALPPGGRVALDATFPLDEPCVVDLAP